VGGAHGGRSQEGEGHDQAQLPCDSALDGFAWRLCRHDEDGEIVERCLAVKQPDPERALWSGLLVVQQATDTTPPRAAMIFAVKGRKDVYGVELLQLSEKQPYEDIYVFDVPPEENRRPMKVLIIKKEREVAVAVDFGGCVIGFSADKKSEKTISVANGKVTGQLYQTMTEKPVFKKGNCPATEPEAPTQPEK